MQLLSADKAREACPGHGSALSVGAPLPAGRVTGSRCWDRYHNQFTATARSGGPGVRDGRDGGRTARQG